MTTAFDAPPALAAAGVTTCGDVAGSGDHRARAVRLLAGRLEVELIDGEVVHLADGELLRATRAPIDAVLRPCGTTVTVTWHDGHRGRFLVSWLAISGSRAAVAA